MNQTQKLVYSMLMENTGIAMMDSGGGEGRHWQQNAKHDPKLQPEVVIELPRKSYTLEKDGQFVRWDDTENELYEWLQKNHSYSWHHAFTHEGYSIKENNPTSDEIEYTVSLFHYLPRVLTLDALCDEFNALPCKDWDSDIYGVSKAGAKWLEAHGLTAGDSWNTYGGECVLSQTLQGTNMHTEGTESQFEFPPYVLLQVHGGADVRGGYTDAKLFKCEDGEYISGTPNVYADLTRADGTVIQLESSYHGYKLSTENGKSVPILDGDSIKASLTYGKTLRRD